MPVKNLKTPFNLYQEQIKNRSTLRFAIGYIVRLKQFAIHELIRRIAIYKGAEIGKNTVLPLKLARRANHNLKVGDNCSIQTDLIDLRAPVHIGSHVIIGSNVEILTCSHYIDSPNWEFKSYGVQIEDYVWLATKVFILPSCQKIEYGAVCAAGAVVVKNVGKMSVVSGNPAQHLKDRQTIHDQLIVSSLSGGDFLYYRSARKNK